MSLFCDHKWESRTGMDSGSHCSKCNALSDREVARDSSGLRTGKLEPILNSIKKIPLFCQHVWQPRSGMDSGSYCSKCNALSDSERPSVSHYKSSQPEISSIHRTTEEQMMKNMKAHDDNEDRIHTKIKKNIRGFW